MTYFNPVFKYGIDKVLTRENKIVINYFSSETELLEWIKQDYRIENIINYQIKDKLKYKFIIKKYLKNSFFANYVLDRIIIRLLKDYKYKSGNILWMGGRSIDSKLINELEKDNKLFLLPQFSGGKLGFIKRRYKFDLLKLKSDRNFNKKCGCIINQYTKGLKKVAFITGINTKLLEIFLKINQKVIKDLLMTLFILKDNKNNINLLIVEQSVIGRQALVVDFFNRNNLSSIEVLHGVPGAVEVGKTDKIAVYGKRDKSFFSSYGVDYSKITITGCPYYDRIFNIKDEVKKYDFLLLILDWIDYVPSNNSYEIIYKQVVMMLKLLQLFQDEKLVIKLHPGQSTKEVEYINHLIKTIIHVENKVEVVKNINIFNLLKNAKIVYNYHSSVGVEALLMKKPLIVLDIFSHRVCDYERYNGCLVARNYKELALATEEILKDVHGYLKKNKENIEKTRQYFSGDLKGESYKNVARVINEMLCK
jgi:hypothetical protein